MSRPKAVAEAASAAPSVPARILNEYVYCPRLAFLEWVQGEFTDNADTVEGRYVHRRVDGGGGALPEAFVGGAECDGDDADEPGSTTCDDTERPRIARSVLLGDDSLGIIARLDLIEQSGGEVVPVDFKRGSAPDIPNRAWDPERVQVCAQGLILRANGYRSDRGVLYFAESKTRVDVEFDDALVAQTLAAIEGVRAMAEAGTIPPPLEDSPKCPRCSLAPICLPDETVALARGNGLDDVRRLYPARDDALPVYVTEPGTFVGKRGEVLHFTGPGKVDRGKARLLDTAQLSLFGNITVSATALRELCERDIPICHFSGGAWFYGLTAPMGGRNVGLRQRQFAAAADPEQALHIARRFIATKIQNCRALLMRNHESLPDTARNELDRLAKRAARASSAATLFGIEGAAARVYFAQFKGMLKATAQSAGFDFEGRNRRPPRDPVNALLSFAYALLTKEATIAARAAGFDPHLGFFHQPRYGRPSLALDLMEEFRPIIADSVVLTAINNGEIGERAFVTRGGATALDARGRRAFIETFERRMDSLVTHPVFGYRISYRRVIAVQARLLARHVAGEIPRYPGFRIR